MTDSNRSRCYKSTGRCASHCCGLGMARFIPDRGRGTEHCGAPRHCCIFTTLSNQVKFINHWSQPLGHHGFDKDFHLQLTFYIVGWAFGVELEIRWPDLQLSELHHCLLVHALQYRVWDSLYAEKRLTEDVRGFVVASLSFLISPARVVADCLFIVDMVTGRRSESHDPLIKDRRLAFLGQHTDADIQRSHQITEIIDDIFDRPDHIFGRSTPQDASSSLEALKLYGTAESAQGAIRSSEQGRQQQRIMGARSALFTRSLQYECSRCTTGWRPQTAT